MDFLERDLEDIIFEVDNEKLRERGLLIVGKKIRQPNLTPYGIADIISYRRDNGSLLIQITELKRKEINADTLLQALGYARAVQRYLRFRRFGFPVRFHITLIGRKVEKGTNFCYISDILKQVTIYALQVVLLIMVI